MLGSSLPLLGGVVVVVGGGWIFSGITDLTWLKLAGLLGPGSPQAAGAGSTTMATSWPCLGSAMGGIPTYSVPSFLL